MAPGDGSEQVFYGSLFTSQEAGLLRRVLPAGFLAEQHLLRVHILRLSVRLTTEEVTIKDLSEGYRVICLMIARLESLALVCKRLESQDPLEQAIQELARLDVRRD